VSSKALLVKLGPHKVRVTSSYLSSEAAVEYPETWAQPEKGLKGKFQRKSDAGF
jgi:hypothetical protein